MNQTRNFSIIAHIDHGKSTLADRILERTHAIDPRKMKAQLLDSMDLERERGITIKLATVTFQYKASDGTVYTMNLIDTPGHVDFTYEVSRSLAACEGALLVVDASQGVEAQTMSNTNLALQNNLVILPVINKIDLPSAEPDQVKEEIEEFLCVEASDALLVSAKTGIGVDQLLTAIIDRIPSPKGDHHAPLRALVFDSHFDPYLGVIAHVRVMDGAIKKGQSIRFMHTRVVHEVDRVGIFTPVMKETNLLSAGDVGYVTAQIKSIRDVAVGDTITDAKQSTSHALPGYKPAKSMVFLGIYPSVSADNNDLRQALEKLRLNDASFTFTPEMSVALGMGFRCGFLGLLHAEIIHERLEREFGLDLIATTPSVVYRARLTDGRTIEIDNPSKMPEMTKIDHMAEPYVEITVFTPPDFIGPVMDLCKERRGEFITMDQHSPRITMIKFNHPFAEVVVDFFDQLKSRTKGYASMDYHFVEYRQADLVKLDVLVNKSPVDALSVICFRRLAPTIGRKLVERLRSVIHRQQYEVAIQAAIGGRIVASDRIRAVRKNVLAKCYGGDVTRKRKLLEKQKEGKKRMKALGNVEIPQAAFKAVLKIK